MWISLIFSMRSTTSYNFTVLLISFLTKFFSFWFVTCDFVSFGAKDEICGCYICMMSDYKTITAFLLRPLFIWILSFCIGTCYLVYMYYFCQYVLRSQWFGAFLVIRSGDEHKCIVQMINPRGFDYLEIISLSLLSDDLIKAQSVVFIFTLLLNLTCTVVAILSLASSFLLVELIYVL